MKHALETGGSLVHASIWSVNVVPLFRLWDNRNGGFELNCRNCGEKIEVRARFCPMCGSLLESDPAKTEVLSPLRRPGRSAAASSTRVLSRARSGQQGSMQSDITQHIELATDTPAKTRHYRQDAVVKGDTKASAPENLVEEPEEAASHVDTSGLDTTAAVFEFQNGLHEDAQRRGRIEKASRVKKASRAEKAVRVPAASVAASEIDAAASADLGDEANTATAVANRAPADVGELSDEVLAPGNNDSFLAEYRKADSKDSTDTGKLPRVSEPNQQVPAKPEVVRADESREFKLIAILLAAVALVAVVFAVYCGFNYWQQLTGRANETRAIPVSIEAPSYATVSGLGVPIHVEGADLNGQQVSQDYLISVTSGELKLKAGTYDIWCAGDLIDGQGRYFARPGDTVHLQVDSNGYVVILGPADSISGAPQFTFKEVASGDITDEQIAGVSVWMKNMGFDDAYTESVVSIARVNRDNYVKNKKDSEEKAASDKEDSEKQAAQEKLAIEIQAAYAANPAQVQTGTLTTLSGTVERVYKSSGETGQSWDGVWYVLRLPAAIYVGRQSVTQIQIAHEYGESADGNGSNLSLDPWEDTVGKSVTVSGVIKQRSNGAHDIFGSAIGDTELRRLFTLETE